MTVFYVVLALLLCWLLTRHRMPRITSAVLRDGDSGTEVDLTRAALREKRAALDIAPEDLLDIMTDPRLEVTYLSRDGTRHMAVLRGNECIRV